ncbi:MAG: hypothetical protein AB9846_03365 [Tenuifilaceae bacterium]
MRKILNQIQDGEFLNKSFRKEIFRIFFISIILLFSCKKDADYRAHFIGNWSFQVTITEGHLGQHSMVTDTNYVALYDGTIKYGLGDDELEIQYTEFNKEILKVNQYGVFIFENSYFILSEGQIIKNHIDLKIHERSALNFKIHIIDGVKKSN